MVNKEYDIKEAVKGAIEKEMNSGIEEDTLAITKAKNAIAEEKLKVLERKRNCKSARLAREREKLDDARSIRVIKYGVEKINVNTVDKDMEEFVDDMKILFDAYSNTPGSDLVGNFNPQLYMLWKNMRGGR